MSIPGIVAHRTPTQRNYPAISLWGGVKAQLDSVSLVMFAIGPRPMVWYYALPTGHLCIYLLACDVNLIDTTEGPKRSARMVNPSMCRSFGISMECSGFALANPVQIMICMCRPVTFPINQTFTGYGPYDCSAFTRDSQNDTNLELYLYLDPDLYHV